MPKAKKSRSPNCWILFSRSFCKIKRELNNIKQREAMKEAKIEWSSMSNIDKRPWQILAHEKKQLKKFEEDLQFFEVKEVDRKSTRLNSSHRCISYAVFCLKKKIK